MVIYSLGVFILCFALTYAMPPDRGMEITRIVGGIPVRNRSAVPYQASLRYHNQHICGASILDEKHVLTASHCCFDSEKELLPAKALKVVVGDLRISKQLSTTVKADVQYIFTHPKYSHKDISNDIAVLRIKGTFGTWNSNVNPISIAKALPKPTTKCAVTGWGKLNSSAQGISDELQIVSVPIISDEMCKQLYGKSLIKKGMFCAGYVEGKKDSCQGDSGGPLTFNNTQVGVVSWGADCAVAFQPGVYTDVSLYKKWIQQQIERSSSRIGSTPSLIFLVSSLITLILFQH